MTKHKQINAGFLNRWDLVRQNWSVTKFDAITFSVIFEPERALGLLKRMMWIINFDFTNRDFDDQT